LSEALAASGVPGALKVSPRPPLHKAATAAASQDKPDPIVLTDDDEDMDAEAEALAKRFAEEAKKKAEAEKKKKEEEAKRRREEEKMRKEADKAMKMEAEKRERERKEREKKAAAAKKAEEERLRKEKVKAEKERLDRQAEMERAAAEAAFDLAGGNDSPGAGMGAPMEIGDRPKTIMDKVATAVQGKSHHKAAGTIVETSDFKQVWVHEQHTREISAPDLPDAQPQTIKSLMPEGEGDEVGDGMAIANKRTDSNVIEFVMVIKTRDNSGAFQVQLPGADVFEDLAGKASWQLMDEKAEYCLVVDTVAVNDSGIGIIGLSYKDFDGAERYRAILRSYSSEEMIVETYPVSDILKRHALTIYLHKHHHTPDHRIGEVLKIMNPGLKGSFTIIYNKLIKSGPREGSRIISLDASEDFLDSLAQFEKNYRFRLANKRFFISGGVRKDSSPSEPVPKLPSEQITSLLNSNMSLILANANRQVEERRRYMASHGQHSEENL
jgi:hypothetical protein